jgi:transcriptional regulator with XRE-family HTH domain
MRRCKLERETRTTLTSAELAKRLRLTPNYLSALENGRAIPSMETFLRYLTAVGFDLRPLLRLSVTKSRWTAREATGLKPLRQELVDQLETLGEPQLRFLAEQIRISEVLDLKVRKTRK